MMFDQSFLTAIGWFPILFYMPLKNRITVPRLGYVKFDPSRKGVALNKGIYLFVGLFGFLLLGIVVFLFSNSSPAFVLWMRENISLFFGTLAVLSFVMAGFVSGIRRMFFHALLAAVFMGGSHLLGFDVAFSITALALALLLGGAAVLFRFLGKYPIPA